MRREHVFFFWFLKYGTSNFLTDRVIWEKISTREPLLCTRGSSLSKSTSFPECVTKCSPNGSSDLSSTPSKR